MPIKKYRSAEPVHLGFRLPLFWIKSLAFCGILFGLWVAVNYQTLREFFQARQRRNETKLAVLDMERQYSSLEREKQALEAWGFPAEKAVRERFKMIRPGEKVILLEPEKTPTADPPQPSPAP